MFERMEIAEYIYEVLVEPYYKKLLGNNWTHLVTKGKTEENPPYHRLTLRWVRALESSENDM